MPAIVSDTTPLNYLVLIEAVQLLPRLLPARAHSPAVRDELTRPKTPGAVRSWIAHSPSWLEVITPALPPDPALSHLDDGETQAIALALECQAELLLLDERDATDRGSSARVDRNRYPWCSGSGCWSRMGGSAYDVRPAGTDHISIAYSGDGNSLGTGPPESREERAEECGPKAL